MALNGSMGTAFQLIINKNSKKSQKRQKIAAISNFSSKNTCVLQLLLQLLLTN